MSDTPRPVAVAYGLRKPERDAAAAVLDLVVPAHDAAFADAVFAHPEAWVLYGVKTFGRIATRQFAPIDGIQTRSALAVFKAYELPEETDAWLMRDVIAAFVDRVSVVLDLSFDPALAYLEAGPGGVLTGPAVPGE